MIEFAKLNSSIAEADEVEVSFDGIDLNLNIIFQDSSLTIRFYLVVAMSWYLQEYPDELAGLKNILFQRDVGTYFPDASRNFSKVRGTIQLLEFEVFIAGYGLLRLCCSKVAFSKAE